MTTFSGFPDPGSSRNTALDTTSATYIGGSLTSSPHIFQDSVTGVSDVSDFYRFRIGASSSDPDSVVTLRLDGLSDNASLVLYDEVGNTLQTANASGTTPELLTRSLNPGVYFVRVGSVSGASTSYNLSLSANEIPIDNGSGNALGAALNIGSLSSSYTTTDYVGNRGVVLDDNDYYRFDLASNGVFNLTLDGLGGNANVELLNSGGTRIASSTQPDTNSESISQSLASGTYYVRVFPGGIGATNYDLNLAFTADPEDFAGNTLATARNINTLSSTPSIFTDFVNSLDTNDYYRFDLASSALIDLTLTPETANADVRLLNSAGTTIVSSSQTGIDPDTIRRSLNAGTYYIRVFPVSGAATNYDLSVSATPIAPDIAPNSRGSANNIGTLIGSQNFSDFVGSIDTNDYYQFDLAHRSIFDLNLSGLSGNADVELLNSSGGLIQSSNLAGNADENINTTLLAGTYFVRVRPISSAETFYNLSLSAETQIEMLEISPGAGSSNPNHLTTLGSTLYFTASDAVNGVQLWQSDGTSATSITNINPGNFNPENLTVFGNNLLFTADDGVNGRELWTYNGTTATMVSNINTGASSNPSNLTVVGSQVFFTADNGVSGKELWVYNGTTVSLVKDIYSGTTGSNPNNLVAFNNKLYFTANDGINGTELWTSNGTTAMTTLVKDIRSDGLSSAQLNSQSLIIPSTSQLMMVLTVLNFGRVTVLQPEPVLSKILPLVRAVLGQVNSPP